MEKERKKYLSNYIYKDYIETKKKYYKEGITEEMIEYNEETIKDCERIRDSIRKQRKKVYEHLGYWIDALEDDQDIIFITFTFSDKALENNGKYNKKKIIEILNNFDDYIVNVDFGGKHGRIHYHALALARDNDLYLFGRIDRRLKSNILDKYKLGYYGVEAVNINFNNLEDKIKLSNYIAKLVQHSNKTNPSYISVKKNTEYQYWKKHKKIWEISTL